MRERVLFEVMFALNVYKVAKGNLEENLKESILLLRVSCLDYELNILKRQCHEKIIAFYHLIIKCYNFCDTVTFI